MALDYLRMKLGLDVGDNNVVIANGDNAPYSQTTSGAYDVQNAQLTAMGLGSQFTDRSSGTVYIKVSLANSNINDWDTVGTSSEDIYQNAFMGKSAGNNLPQYGSNNVVTDNASLETSISDLDAEIGAAVSPVTRTNNPTLDQAINLNISALDAAIGTDAELGTPVSRTNNPITVNSSLLSKIGLLDDAIGGTPGSLNVIAAASSVNTNLSNLDAEIGAAIASPVSRTIGAISDQAINLNIEALDDAIGNDVVPVSRTNNAIAAGNDVNANIEQLDKAIGTDAQLTNTNYIGAANSVNQNLSALDGQVNANSNAIAALEVGVRTIEKVKVVTADDISAASGTGVSFTDDNTGGSITLQVGDRIASTHVNSNDAIYIVQAGAWTSNALVTDDAFFTSFDLPDVVNQEGVSLYKYNGTTIEEIADFDFETAATIGMASYTAGSGDITGADTIQTAIQKLDGNTDSLLTVVGVAQGATNLGTIGGGAGADEILTDSETVKSAITKLGDEIGTAVTNTSWNEGSNAAPTAKLSDQPVNSNIDIIADSLAKLDIRRTYTGTPTNQVLDSLTVSDSNSGDDMVEWYIRVHDTTNSRKYATKILALADVGLSEVDITEQPILRLGSADIAGLVLDVTISGSTMSLEITASVGVEVKVQRTTI